MVTALRVDGVDISHHQSGTLDLPLAKRDGVRFLYHKATEGDSYKDANYTRRREECKKAGIPFGAYHFARADVGDAEREARFFLSVAKPQPGDLVPALDLETTEGLSQEQLKTWAITFSRVVKKAIGVLPVLYCPWNFGLPNLRWVPRYNNTNTPPTIPWDIWQFSNGQFGVPNNQPGIGRVDLNTMKNGLRVAEFLLPKKDAGDEPDPKPEPRPGGTKDVEFEAVVWNVYAGTKVEVLRPIAKRLVADGVTVFLMCEAGGSDITRMLEDLGLETKVDGPDIKGVRPQWRIAWDPKVWDFRNPVVFTAKQPFAQKGGGDIRNAMLEGTLVHRATGTEIYAGSYHTPAHVQVAEDELPERRLLVLKEMAGHWKDVSTQHDRILFGGDDNVDEGRSFKDRFEFMKDANTGLRQVQAPAGTHGRIGHPQGRRIDDFRVKGLKPVGEGYVRPGGGDHGLFVQRFAFTVAVKPNPKDDGFGFRFVTQNVKALPLMPQDDVVEDVVLTASQAGIVCWQEIIPQRYEDAIRDLGPDWAHLDNDGGCPISWRVARWNKVDSGKVLLHKGEAKISKDRYLTWVLLEHLTTGQQMLVHNWHYVAGAWNKTVEGNQDRREALWAQDNKVHREFVTAWVKKGVPIIGGGDSNSRLERALLLGKEIGGRAVRYPVGRKAIDHIVLIDGAKAKWTTDDADGELLPGRNSDHQGRRSRVRLVPAA